MSLNNDMRQNIQRNLDFSSSPTGEAQRVGREESESLRTTSVPESPARTDRMMEEIVERENLKEALRRVKASQRYLKFAPAGRLSDDLVVWTRTQEGDRWRPVSYTHLRAHETVLDLV